MAKEKPPELLRSLIADRAVIDSRGCWIWTRSRTRDGYGRTKINSPRRNRSQLAHRVSYEAFVGPIPAGMQVLHDCDVRCCVNPKHLFLGTQLDNIADMVRKGRQAGIPGEKHHRARLKERDVIAIRSSTSPSAVLAKRYGIKQGTVRDIIRRRLWKHVA